MIILDGRRPVFCVFLISHTHSFHCRCFITRRYIIITRKSNCSPNPKCSFTSSWFSRGWALYQKIYFTKLNTFSENFVKENGIPQRLPGHNYSHNQMFWISSGQIYCSKIKDGTLQSDILTDDHSPKEFRIKGSLSNNNDFARDFNCPVGSKMNPQKKCTVW